MKNFIKQLLLAFTALGSVFVAIAEPQAIHLKKGQQRLAVFATLHVAKPDFYPLPKAVTEALSHSDALAVEMDVTDPKVISETMQLMVNSKQTKGMRLDAARLKQLQQVIGPMAAGFADMPLAFVALTASIMRAEQLGYTATGVDITLINNAKSLKKTILSLETPAEQMGSFEDIPDAEAVVLFDNTFSEQGVDDIRKAESLWKTNDKAIAEQLIAQTQADTPQLYQRLVIERNRNMAQRIAEQNQRYPRLFVAIGALHLYGTDSVVDLLEKAGYQRLEQ